MPHILFLENVPQLVSEKNEKDFRAWCSFLEKMGYSNYGKILNAKDYGVPQNRERYFMFSFLGDYDYIFPEPIPLKKRLKDILEDEVDDKYYISKEKTEKLVKDLIAKGIIDRQTDCNGEQSMSSSGERNSNEPYINGTRLQGLRQSANDCHCRKKNKNSGLALDLAYMGIDGVRVYRDCSPTVTSHYKKQPLCTLEIEK